MQVGTTSSRRTGTGGGDDTLEHPLDPEAGQYGKLATTLRIAVDCESDVGRDRGASPCTASRSGRSFCGLTGLLGVVPPAQAQDCSLGAQLGAVAAASDMPAGAGNELDATGGFSAASTFECDVGVVTLGLTPEMSDLGPVRLWGLSGSVGFLISLGTSLGAPWLQPQVLGGVAVADRTGSSLGILLPGRQVDLPKAAPALGAALRLALPVGSSGVAYFEPGVRVAWFPTEDEGESAGAHRFATLPFRVGYAFRF